MYGIFLFFNFSWGVLHTLIYESGMLYNGQASKYYEVEFEMWEWRRGEGKHFGNLAVVGKQSSVAPTSGKAVRTVCVRVPAQASTPVTFWFVKFKGGLVLHLLSKCPDADQAVGGTSPHAKLVLTSPQYAA